MIAGELVAELSRQGITLWVEGERLKYRAPKGALSPEALSLLSTHKDALVNHLRQDAADGESIHPLSHGQQALWFVAQLAPDSIAYNTALSLRIVTEVDVPALRRACQRLVERHGVLRTTFGTRRGQPVQKVRRRDSLCFEHVLATDEEPEALRARVTRAYEAPFDLEQGPLMRVHLFSRTAREHVLLIAIHHIVYDGWSLLILGEELLRHLYPAEKAGVPAALPAPRATYTDYVRWQSEMLAGATGQRLWDYWSKQLAGAPSSLDLPFAKPRPSVQTYAGASVPVLLRGTLPRQLRAICEQEGVTLYTLLLAAYLVLLHRYSGQEDLLVGSPSLGRTQPEFAKVVGNFMNMVVLRGDLSGDPVFRDLLRQLRQTVVGALAHQDFPFHLLVEKLNPERHADRSPLFQAVFMLQPTPKGDIYQGAAAGGLVLRPFDLPQQQGQFDLSLELSETEDSLGGVLKFRTDLFDEAQALRMVGHLTTLLEAIVESRDQRVSDLPLLTSEERREVLETWNDTSTEGPVREVCIHGLFEEQVQRTPDTVALISGRERLSYRELDLQANRLAHRLRALGVGPEVRVGLCVSRGAGMVVGMLGILKAGGAYVPMDPTYPAERLAYMLTDSRAPVVVSESRLRVLPEDARVKVVWLDAEEPAAEEPPSSGVGAENVAYTLYTSGSTGRPKAVLVCHRNIERFFAAMDDALEGTSPGVWLATTSMSFDISVLELLYSLTRGFQVVLRGEQGVGRKPVSREGSRKPLEFSLFYFASDEREHARDKYRLLLEGARFADAHGFTAVWTPERHFHAFGGLYPNPSVVSAALAATTRNIRLRAGSIVLPLHNPIRVAEEWAVVDNLSGGRVDLSFASGWHPNDFVLAPERFADARSQFFEQVALVRKLWKGDAVSFRNGQGQDVRVQSQPRPIQPEVPVWVTAAGNPETFRAAGEAGASVLTHLLGQNLPELSKKLQLYRAAWKSAGHGPGRGHVTLMLHTFMGEDVEAVRQKVDAPLRQYLKSSLGLLRSVIGPLPHGEALESLSEEDVDLLLSRAVDRYFHQMGLFGDVESCLPLLEKLRELGVDEVACLIDFGVDVESTLAGLHTLAALKERCQPSEAPEDDIPTLIARHGVTHFQCTPSMLRMLLLEPEGAESLRPLEKLLVGGEPFPVALARQVLEHVEGDVLNMYGPTETTIWSSFDGVRDGDVGVTIGRPIADTRMYVLDPRLRPVPLGVPGEVFIGGEGVARGYLHRPELTAERFMPDPWGTRPGDRMYRTGDLARHAADGRIEFLGRLDTQVKVRGVRIELGEIEAALRRHPDVPQAVVVARPDAAGEVSLIAYVVTNVSPSELSRRLREQLPASMIPAHFVQLEALPMTPNQKLDVRALPLPDAPAREVSAAYVAPRDALELELVSLWEELFDLRPIGVTSGFFALGGHSLLAVRLMSRLRARFGRPLPVSLLFQADTIQDLADLLRRQEGGARVREPLVRIQETGDKPPLFFVHPTGGDVLCYAPLSRQLGPRQPFFALQALMDSDSCSVEEMAARYLEEVRRVRPSGPYRLGGWSTGGIVAQAMARQLEATGEHVELLVLLETWSPELYQRAQEPGALMAWFATDLLGGTAAARLDPARLESLDEGGRLRYLVEHAKALGALPGVELPELEQRFRVFERNARALARYRPEPYAGRVLFLQAEQLIANREEPMPAPAESWGERLSQARMQRVPGNHYTMLQAPYVREVADRMAVVLEELGAPVAAR
ncbi:non-ribosomal peptide synthetase [Myxococcus stipitatus DSM 14675]|uniref:Non-ribosomal peptide synthetase n=1 Tax=Myxococcus stipitatus (strain DSM 14675 / JCM 12634 / Mx s8) TaxID=1278073 RepID=L7UBH9_MYXSD|nr:MupA/Atu3671 family FMN-dependent luciferase-like monooxygenase [Myxococcus stipitatus]AGC46256.1 non-ribosomal peptide synthetase [Myxococcus stipitatus DSM 14675]